MRKIIVLSFITLDGIMQAPGGPEEDTSDNFEFGGWTVPYFDEVLGATMGEQMGRPFDLLLGRKTFDIFAGYWPEHDNEIGAPINNATKYVASNTIENHSWQKSVFMKGDVVRQIGALKEEEGPELQVHGSANFIQTLLSNDLVDEFWLKIFPITLGKGKRLFGDGAMPYAFKPFGTKTTPSGVIIANFRRDGEVETGSF
ncbi:dihydrofolate reductase family protein [Sneathiella sp.]|uniref:dihydrofolate reductase family protein n=1 Tax=Sneathiella sp. TaxID=1964365 RepID=UPI00261B0A2E|nr:dihydrofolate reductase family protein [Sneathiella sp.]MDF2368790.1 dihydrofolate reductase family protein [Sneathiella sp.]